MTQLLNKLVERVTMTEPKVQFGLWAMLSFLLTLGAVCVGFLYAEGKDAKKQIDINSQRLTQVEANYQHIIKGVDKLIISLEKVDEKLDRHRMGDNGKKVDK
jgi:hypothetical protein